MVTRSRTVIIDIDSGTVSGKLFKRFRGDGSTAVFDIGRSYASGTVEVYQDGIRLEPYVESDDTDSWLNKFWEADASAGTIQFLHAPPSDCVLGVWYTRG